MASLKVSDDDDTAIHLATNNNDKDRDEKKEEGLMMAREILRTVRSS